MTVLLVAAGGACGALLRYAVNRWFAATHFPWATLIVNVTGSLLLGVVAASTEGWLLTLLGHSRLRGTFHLVVRLPLVRRVGRGALHLFLIVALLFLPASLSCGPRPHCHRDLFLFLRRRLAEDRNRRPRGHALRHGE